MTADDLFFAKKSSNPRSACAIQLSIQQEDKVVVD